MPQPVVLDFPSGKPIPPERVEAVQPLRVLITTAVVSVIPVAGVAGLVWAEYVLLLPTMIYLRGELGWVLAAMLPAAEVAMGFRRELLLKAGRRAELALGLMVALAISQVALAYLSTQAVVHAETVQALEMVPQGKCEAKEPPAGYIGHPQSIEKWEDGERARLAQCQAAQDGHQDKQIAAVKDRTSWEAYLLAALAGIVSMVIGVCAGAVADLVTALLAIPGAVIAAIDARRKARKETPPPPPPLQKRAPKAAPKRSSGRRAKDGETDAGRLRRAVMALMRQQLEKGRASTKALKALVKAQLGASKRTAERALRALKVRYLPRGMCELR